MCIIPVLWRQRQEGADEASLVYMVRFGVAGATLADSVSHKQGEKRELVEFVQQHF